MSNPSVAPNQAAFFTEKNYGGDKFEYEIGPAVSLPGNLNDRFKSVKVGTNAKVIAWQHYSETGYYREWTGDVPDISNIGGLSRFQVVSHNTRAISFLFQDATGGAEKQYSLKVDARDVGTVVLYSAPDDDGDYGLVGIMPKDGPPVTTAIFVRDEHSGIYIAVGSVYFKWNSSTDEVDIVEDENWPKQLTHRRTGPSAFLVTLVDNTPSS